MTEPQVQVPDMEQIQEVVDTVEAQYGDSAKAVKKVKVKKVDAHVAEKPVMEQKAETPKEPVAETKTEPKAEPKPIETKVDEWNDPLAATPTKPVVDGKIQESKKEVSREIPAEQVLDENKLPEYKKKAEVVDKLTATQSGKFLLQLAQEGGDVLQAIQELQPKEYSTMSDSEVLKEYFVKKDKLSGEDLQNAIDEHESLPLSMQRKFVRDARTELNYDQQDRFSKYTQVLNQNKNNGQEAFNHFLGEVDNVLESSYFSKPAYGITLSAEQKKELSEDSKKFLSRVIDREGNINANLVAFCAFAEKHLRTAINNSRDSAKSKGREEVLNVIHNVDRNDNTLQSPQPSQKITDKERIDKIYGGKSTN